MPHWGEYENRPIIQWMRHRVKPGHSHPGQYRDFAFLTTPPRIPSDPRGRSTPGGQDTDRRWSRYHGQTALFQTVDALSQGAIDRIRAQCTHRPRVWRQRSHCPPRNTPHQQCLERRCVRSLPQPPPKPRGPNGPPEAIHPVTEAIIRIDQDPIPSEISWATSGNCRGLHPLTSPHGTHKTTTRHGLPKPPCGVGDF